MIGAGIFGERVKGFVTTYRLSITVADLGKSCAAGE